MPPMPRDMAFGHCSLTPPIQTPATTSRCMSISALWNFAERIHVAQQLRHMPSVENVRFARTLTTCAKRRCLTMPRVKSGERALRGLVDRFCTMLGPKETPPRIPFAATGPTLRSYGSWAGRARSIFGRHASRCADTSPSSTRRMFAAYQQASFRASLFFRWAVARGHAESDHMAFFRGPRRQAPAAIISAAEMAKLLARMRKRRTEDMRNKAILGFSMHAELVRTSDLLACDVVSTSSRPRYSGKAAKGESFRCTMRRGLHAPLVRGWPVTALLGGKECPHFFVSTRGNKMTMTPCARCSRASCLRAWMPPEPSTCAMHLRPTFLEAGLTCAAFRDARPCSRTTQI